MILPPPNITGNLHLGHALTVTIQDVLVRWKRMQGIETVWVPGFDHAGIATQVVVEKQLWKKCKKTRHQIGREEFTNLLNQWKQENATFIGEQLHRLGASLDWSREVFTMDPVVSEAVLAAFVKLFEAGLIYRGDFLVNWSCILQSAISDIEVEHFQVNGPTNVQVPGYEKPVQFGRLYNFAYKLQDSDEEIVVATTRPETLLGDVAVAVHPSDDRYIRFVGRCLRHPFRNDTIPVVADDYVDPNFGTGAVKVTPAHDHNDFGVAERHKLPLLQIIDESGKLTPACGRFAGIKRFDGRDIILTELERLGLLREIRDHQMIVPICSRSQDVIELLVRPQWFLNSSEMARRAVEDVRTGRLSIEPKQQFEKIWFNWLENIRDWCISRQLWWGHRIPAYSCRVKSVSEKTIWVAAKNVDEAKQKVCVQFNTSKDQVEAKQDEDVLDTWFSSSLLPFASFGWPKQTDDLSKYYPLSLMETGHDILFFWVARMVMLGTYLTKQLPFDKILLHAIVCDAHGRKMSKSLGNVIAPEDVITGASVEKLKSALEASQHAGVLSQEEIKKALQGQKKMFPEGIPECGADALRFTLCSHNIKSHFINFDVQECYVNKLFCNKIWQATKFCNMWTTKLAESQKLAPPPPESMHLMDKWILSRLSLMVNSVNQCLGNYDFHVCTAALKNFLYYDFCDIYLECTKRGLRAVATDNQNQCQPAMSHCWTLTTCLDVGLRALAPFMPILAQHLHRHLTLFPGTGTGIGSQRDVVFPQDLEWRNLDLERAVDEVMKAVICIRRLKKTFNVTAKHKPEVFIYHESSLLEEYKEVIEDLSACYQAHINNQADGGSLKNAVTDTVDNITIHLSIPDDLKQSFNADLPKLRTKRIKLQKELERINTIVSGESYSEKASPETLQLNRKKIATLEEKIQRINYMEKLSH